MGVDYTAIGDRIRQRRSELKITQEKLGYMVGVSNSHISSIERAEKTPSLDTLLLICGALGISTDYLVNGTIYTDVDDEIVSKIRICSVENKKRISRIVDVFVEEEKLAK